MKKSIILLIGTLVLFSCQNAKTEKEANQKEKTESSSVSSQVADGEFVQKYPSGAIQIKGEMKNDQRVGLWTSYYENGMKQSESTYQNGVLHGRTASFYTNGQVRYIGYFQGGEKDGKWEFYTEQGQFEKSEMYLEEKVTK